MTNPLLTRAQVCRICNRADCDDDCEELALIYREQQREKLRDIELTPDEIEAGFRGDYAEDYDR